jgi:hypothetical protein
MSWSKEAQKGFVGEIRVSFGELAGDSSRQYADLTPG